MPELVEPQIERFLDLVSKGMDLTEAAHAVGEIPSTFHILSLDDLNFRQQLISARVNGRRNRQSWKFVDPDNETLEEFLQLVRDGRSPSEAALMLDINFACFAKLMNHAKPTYRADFHQAYQEAAEEGRPAMQNRIRSLMWRAAENNEYRATRDLAIMYLPEGEKLSSKKVEVTSADQEALKQAALQIDRNKLDRDELNELIRLIEKGTGQAKLELESGQQ